MFQIKIILLKGKLPDTSQFGEQVASKIKVPSDRRPVASYPQSSTLIGALGAPPLPRPDELGPAGDVQMNGPTNRVTLEDLIKIDEFSTNKRLAVGRGAHRIESPVIWGSPSRAAGENRRNGR